LLYKQQERKEQAQVVEVGERWVVQYWTWFILTLHFRRSTSEVDALAPILAHYWSILDVAMVGQKNNRRS
jgi:hypothetical protein